MPAHRRHRGNGGFDLRALNKWTPLERRHAASGALSRRALGSLALDARDFAERDEPSTGGLRRFDHAFFDPAVRGGVAGAGRPPELVDRHGCGRRLGHRRVRYRDGSFEAQVFLALTPSGGALTLTGFVLIGGGEHGESVALLAGASVREIRLRLMQVVPYIHSESASRLTCRAALRRPAQASGTSGSIPDHASLASRAPRGWFPELPASAMRMPGCGRPRQPVCYVVRHLLLRGGP